MREKTARVVIRGHAFGQNLRRRHYGLDVDSRCQQLRSAAVFDEPVDMV